MTDAPIGLNHNALNKDEFASPSEIEALRNRIAELESTLAAERSVVSRFSDAEPARGTELTTIVLFGADGNLAMKKTYPTLYALWRKKLLPKSVVIVGYARDTATSESFRRKIYKSIYSSAHPQQERTSFLDRCHYVSGQFNEVSHLMSLSSSLAQLEAQQDDDFGLSAATSRLRIFYLAVPPFLYAPILRALRDAGLRSRTASFAAGDCDDNDEDAPEDVSVATSVTTQTTLNKNSSSRLRSRFVLEKPFGHDTESCRALCLELGALVSEEEAYRIDHYLGKELVMNVLVLRFANICFEAIWSRSHVKRVEVCCSEELGTAGRGGYFDEYGIIRDVMQNHLAQILALVAMEQPLSFAADDIRREKVKVLRSVRALDADRDCVVGQYDGYTEDDTVTNKQTKTETFAAARLFIDNPRWAGVPFVLVAGKALSHKKVEVRIRFHRVAGAVPECVDCAPNELVVRVQPDECIYWRVQNRVPGLHRELRLEPRRMNLLYTPTEHRDMPEAYERLLLEVLRGDSTNFVSVDELDAAWAIFTPALHKLAQREKRPERYAFGSEGPSIARLIDPGRKAQPEKSPLSPQEQAWSRHPSAAKPGDVAEDPTSPNGKSHLSDR